MNDRTEFDRIAQSWLQDGPTEMPDRSLQAALDEVHVTSQRRFGAARRTIHMNGNAPRFAVAAVIGLLILIGGGIYLGNSGSGGIGGQPTATPSATPTAAPSATATTTPAPSSANLKPGVLCMSRPAGGSFCQNGGLDPGTYSFDTGTVTPARLSFTVPAGWATTEGFVNKGAETPGEVQFSTWEVTHIFADACNDDFGTIDVGTTIDQLASALAAQQGHSSSAVTDVTVGDLPAKRIEMTLAARGCSSGVARIWPGPGPDLNSGYCCMAAGATETVYAVAIGDERLVIAARHLPGSSATDLAELEAVIDSIAIEPPAASPSAAP